MDLLSKINLPPEYRRRLLQGVAAWAVLSIAAIAWVGVHASATRADLEGRIPHIAGDVKTIYLTPQIKDEQTITFSGGDGQAVSAQGAYVTLIVSDLGLSDDVSQRAVEDMPDSVALAFSPYGDLARWIKEAKDGGHEAVVLLPMEPFSYPKDDPGPKALLTRVSDEENAEVLSGILKQSNGATAIMSFMGSEFLANKKDLGPVFATLGKVGAIFIENKPGDKSVAAATATEASLPYMPVDVVLDATATESDVAQRLAELENLARTRGYAVGVASPYPVSFNMIKSWSEKLDARGVKMIPLSAMMKVKTRHAADAQQQPPAQ